MNTGVIHHHVDPCDSWGRGGAVQRCQEVTKERMGVAGAEAIDDLAGGAVEGPSQIKLGVLAWRPHFLLAAFGPPGRTHFGQQVDVERIGKDPHLMHSGLAAIFFAVRRVADPGAPQLALPPFLNDHGAGEALFVGTMGVIPHGVIPCQGCATSRHVATSRVSHSFKLPGQAIMEPQEGISQACASQVTCCAVASTFR